MANIIIAFPKLEEAEKIKKLFLYNGYPVDTVCTTGDQVLASADRLGSGVIVCGYRLADTNYLRISEDKPAGFEMLLITGRAHALECQENGIMCLVSPFRGMDLVRSLEVLIQNVESKRRRARRKPTQRNEREQKLIDDAKLLLIEKNNMTEQEAHRYLQKNAMDQGLSLVEYSRIVLEIMYRE